MIKFHKSLLTLATLIGVVYQVSSQSVPFPKTPTKGTIGPWGYEQVWTDWDTSPFLPFKYEGTAYRLMPPNSVTYDSDTDIWDFGSGEKYPLLVHFHGRPENGTDNNKPLMRSGKFHRDAVLNDEFRGFLLYTQNGTPEDNKAIIDQMIEDGYPIDPTRIYAHGLSRGGIWCWEFAQLYPEMIAAIFPMSGIDPRDYSGITYTPIRQAQGENDTNPTPSASMAQKEKIDAQGGFVEYIFYEGVGHGTWNRSYNLDDYFSWFLSHRTNKVYAKYGYHEVCPEDPIEVILGVKPYNDGYEWAKDGNLIIGADTSELFVDSFGDYTARININGEWTDWSDPLTVGERVPTETPPIELESLVSYVLPDPNGSTTVDLTLPDGYETYSWNKGGIEISTEQTISVGVGEYTALVQEKFGCSSESSDIFRVIEDTGVDVPLSPSNLSVKTVSKVALILTWIDNAANETFTEVYRRTALTDPYELVGLVAADEASFEDTDLISGVEYYYSLRTINDQGASELSIEISVVTDSDEENPTTPLNLLATDMSTKQVLLTWGESTDNVGVDRYEIYQNEVLVLSETDITTEVYNLTEGQTYRFTVRAVDQSGNKSPHSERVIVSKVKSGLKYKYYEGNWTLLPDFDALTPVSEGTSSDIDISVSLSNNFFGFLWEGYIYIPVAGEYTFETYSDDGSKFYIGDYDEANLVVDNDGSHGKTYQAGTYTFPEAGVYPIVVTYFERTGANDMELYWSNTPHGVTDREVIPESYYVEELIPEETVLSVKSFTATAISESEINLDWLAGGDNEINYQIHRSIDGENYIPIALVSGSTTSYSDTNLEAYTKYYYKIVSLGLYDDSEIILTINPTLNMTMDNSVEDFSGQEVSSSTVGIVSFDESNKKVGTHAVSFTNPDSYISLDDGGTYSRSAFSERSIAFWLYTESTSGIQDVMEEGGNIDGYLIRINEGNIEFGVSKASSQASISSPLVTDQWVHIVTSFDNGKISLYIDGVLVAEDNDVGYTSVPYHSDPGGLGATNNNNCFKSVNNNFSGLIDDFYVLEEVLTEEDISQLINHANDASRTSATTIDTPQSSDALTNFKAVLETDLSVSLSWDTNDVQAYQVLRSKGTSDNFNLIGYLAPSKNEYIDTDTDARNTYYYFVRSRIATGYSDHSDTLMVFINNTAPELITDLSDYTLFHEELFTQKLEAVDANGDVITISGHNFPDFVSIEEGSVLTIDPSDTDFGVYENLVISLDDNYGGVTSDTFDLEVFSNYTPLMQEIAPYVISEGSLSTISFGAEDPNGDNLLWSYSTLPSFVTAQQDEDTLRLSFSPELSTDGGVYSIELRVDDDNAIAPYYATHAFSLTVIPYDPNHSIYINFGSSEVSASPWNSFLAFPNVDISLDNLVNDHGFVTNTSLTMDSRWGGSSTSGGLTSSLFGSEVSTSYIWTKEDTEQMRLSGLDPSSTYNFTFFASRSKTDDRTTLFEIGDQSVSLQAAGNNDNLVSIDGVSPNLNGEITISTSNGGSSEYGYLNAMIVEVISISGVEPLRPTSLEATLENDAVTLIWEDNALNETGFEIYRSEGDSTNYQYLDAVGANETTFIDTLLPTKDVYYQVRSSNSFGSSDYSNEVEIIYSNRPPVVTVEATLEITAAEDRKLAIHVSDIEGDTFVVNAVGIPLFGSRLEMVDTENWEITFSPSIYDVGSYMMTLEVTDNFSNVVTTVISINVVNIVYDTLYVNLGADEGLLANAPWNNLLGKDAGLNITDLLNSKSESTGYGIEMITSWNSGNDKGAITGNDSGIHPDIVMENFIADNGDDLDIIRLSGLEASKLYDFKLFASRADISNRITTYEINGTTEELNVADNTSEAAEIKKVSPEVDGTITITIDKGSSSYKYLNSIEIIYYEEPVFPSEPTNLVAQAVSKNAITVTWEDNSTNEEGYELLISSTGGVDGSWTTIALGANTTIYEHTGLSSDTEYFYKLRSYNSISPSYYTSTVSESTYNYLVYINLGATGYEAGFPWNNFLTSDGPFEGDFLANLTNGLGSNTGINIEVVNNDTYTTFAGANRSSTGGMVTGNDSGVYPDVVMQSYYWIENYETASLELSNMPLNQEYDVSFFASRDRTGTLISQYTIDDQTSSINTTSNTMDVALVKKVTPEIDGTMQIDVLSEDGWGYIGAIVLQASSMSSEALSLRQMELASSIEKLEEEVVSILVVYPNPFEEELSIKVESGSNHELIKFQIFNQVGQQIYDDEIISNIGNQIIKLGTKKMSSGIYFLRVVQGSDNPQVFKLTK